MKWTPHQENAIITNARYVCVDAGAGSGKTRVLIDRILHLIEARDVRLEDIVAITFTDKAAAEMKERLRRAFNKKAPSDDPEAMNRWRDLEQRVVHARISTIHSFCMNILRENALRLGYDPDFGLLDEADGILLRMEVLRETMHDLLNEGEPHAHYLATAFGVDRLMRILRALLTRTLPLEFWEKTLVAQSPETRAETLLAHWRAMIDAEYQRRLDQAPLQPEIGRYIQALKTYASLCSAPQDEREMRRQRYLASLQALQEKPPREKVLRELQCLQQKRAEGFKFSSKNWPDEATHKGLTKLLEEIQKWAEQFVAQPEETEEDLDAVSLTCAFYPVFVRVIQAYEAAKAERQMLDFDNLINRACAALQSDEALRNRVAQGIRYLLIDEFQDTDQTQLEIARLLCNAPSGPALFIVGDPKQSIYYFRGADVTVFRSAHAEAEENIPLDKNFRTLPDVMNFINGFFKTSGLLNAVEAYAPMAVHREPREDACIEFILADDEDCLPENAAGAKVRAEDRRRREATLIAERIHTICHSEEALVYDETLDAFRPARYGDVTLLFRSMSNVHLYEAALRQAGIPYALIAGRGFYERQEIRDLLQFLKVLVDSGDELALAGFLRGPFSNLSDETLMRLARAGGLSVNFFADSIPDAEAMGVEECERLQAARALIARFRIRLEAPVAQLLREILEETPIEAILLDQFLGAQRVSNLRKLIDVAEDFSQSRPHTLRGFIAYLEEVRGGGIREGEAVLQPEGEGAVLLMTIHKSKGLEFPVVILPDTAQGRVGSQSDDYFMHPKLGLALKSRDEDGAVSTPVMGHAIKTRIKEEEQAEHARLLYVAMTRARDYLIFSGASRYEKQSWLEVLDPFLQLNKRPHGKVLQGQGWLARITRQRTPSAFSSDFPATDAATGDTLSTSSSHPVTAQEKLARQLERIRYMPPQPPAFVARSISSVMDALAEGLDEQESSDIEARIPYTRNRAARYAMARGTAVHRLFELWDFSQNQVPELSALLRDCGLAMAQRDALAEELSHIATAFQASTLFPLFRDAEALQRETPFLLPVGGVLLSGVLDALINQRIIVDFKTGQCTPERQQRYRWQIALYAAAVEQLLGAPAAEGILYYVDQDQVDRFPITRDAVNEALKQAESILHSAAQATS